MGRLLTAGIRSNPCRLAVALVVAGLSLYANAPRLLGSRALVAFVPPFQAGWDANMNDHLGGEYLRIARSLAAGEGFASPFRERSGPTAWMPPAYPFLLAALLLALKNITATAVVIVLLQDLALIVTGWMVLDVASRTVDRPAAVPAALLIYCGSLLYNFQFCFQFTHDSWMIMTLIALLLAGSLRLRGREPDARPVVGWGAFGGICALATPVLGIVWGALTAPLARRSWGPQRTVASLLVAAAVVSPWIARNYRVFHRFIPIKSNIFFELQQSYVMERDGVLRLRTFDSHPYQGVGGEWRLYKAGGETVYLDLQRRKFLDYLRTHPADCAIKLRNRALAATINYIPFDDSEQGLTLLASRLIHPLPFYSMILVLLLEGRRTDPAKRIAIVIYFSYLLPYIVISYYERYLFALCGVQCLFCLWGWDLLLRVKERIEAAGLELAAGESPPLRRESPGTC